MTGFGDDDPEDSWDAGDPADEKLNNLRRRIAVLEQLSASVQRRHRVELALEDLDDLEPEIAAYLYELRLRFQTLR